MVFNVHSNNRRSLLGMPFPILLILMLLPKSHAALVSCDQPVSKLRLCSLVSDYDQGMPASASASSKPVEVVQSMTLFSVAEINYDQSTMTLNVLIALVWNDTRLSLKSSSSDE